MIMPPSTKGKGMGHSLATIIVGSLKPKDSEAEVDTAKEGCMKASEELLLAIKEEDAQKVFEALSAFSECYEEMSPEEESSPGEE